MEASGTANPYHKTGDFGEGKVSWNEYPEFQIWEEGRLAGIKEVVEWIETKSSSHSNGKLYAFIESEWQSKLKEWRIK